MTNENPVPQRIDEYIQSELQTKDPDAQIQVKRTSLGWLKLSVTTKLFENLSLSEREAFIDTMLTTLNLSLGQYPFADYVLLTPHENSTHPRQSAIQLPLWSEILMAPEPDISLPIDEDLTKRPFVITFYSLLCGCRVVFIWSTHDPLRPTVRKLPKLVSVVATTDTFRDGASLTPTAPSIPPRR